MTNIQLSLTPAMEAYLIALIYRNTRTSYLSLSAVGAHISHNRLQRMLYEKFAWSRRLWDFFAAGMARGGGYRIIDDTAWARWAVRSEAVSWVWSSLSARQLKQHYRKRQQIEEVFRLLKQEFGWGGTSAQRARAQVAHVHRGLYERRLTELAAIKEKQTVYSFKREL